MFLYLFSFFFVESFSNLCFLSFPFVLISHCHSQNDESLYLYFLLLGICVKCTFCICFGFAKRVRTIRHRIDLLNKFPIHFSNGALGFWHNSYFLMCHEFLTSFLVFVCYDDVQVIFSSIVDCLILATECIGFDECFLLFSL